MPEPTPGEVAFCAWECAMLNRSPAEVTHLWPVLGAHEQHAWEAAAQAVRAMQEEERQGCEGPILSE